MTGSGFFAKIIKDRRETFHPNVYFYLIIILAASMPLSIFLTSFIQILLLINWILEGNYSRKWQRLKTEKAFWIFFSLYLVHIIGMIWSEDLSYGLKDLKIKLPLIIVPFLVVTSESLTKMQVRRILTFFIAGCLVGSLLSLLAIAGFLNVEINDYRDASLFIDHIRFSLMVVLSILIAAYLFFNNTEEEHKIFRWIYVTALLWLPVFLLLLRSLSGIVILIVIILFIGLRLVRTVPDRAARFMLTVFILFIPIFALFYISNSINRFYSIENLDPESLDSLTINGNRYIHHPENKEIENGNYVWINVVPEELKKEWEEVSDVDYMGRAENGSFLRFTLIRYLTSKGLRKDSVGFHQLDSVDISAIEKGVANHIYLNKYALYPRIYEVIWEFDRFRLGYSPNDKSIVQRLFYLKAGYHIFSENLLYGVGTGDVRNSFEKYYEQIHSPLRMERRRRAHNQYLSFGIAFGIPGLLWCLFAIFYPVVYRKRWSSYMAVVFLIIISLSMLNEDTLENTAGAVMFGFFYGLFVFGPHWQWKNSRQKISDG